MKFALGMVVVAVLAASAAGAGSGRTPLASDQGWTAYSLDGFSYMEKDEYHVSETACMLEAGSKQAGMRIVFFPGASVRILQVGSRDWELKARKARLKLVAGGQAATLKGAQYDGEFIQHVDSSAKGMAALEALAAGGPELRFVDNKGKALMALPIAGYEAMLARAVACAKDL